MKEAVAGLRPSLCHGVRCQFGANFWWVQHLSLILAAALIVLLPAGPCFAVDAKQKMATCTFGADQQRLQGEARDAFLKKCMEDRDDPRGRTPAGTVTAPKQ
jgi:hypothetical protein